LHKNTVLHKNSPGCTKIRGQLGSVDGMSDEPKKRSWVSWLLLRLILIVAAWFAVAYVLKVIFLSPP
jgi:hypothetical protein